MNIKLKPTELATRSNDSTASNSTSGAEKNTGGVKLESKPGRWSRLRSLSEGFQRATGLGRARKHTESAVPKARFAPIKQEAPTARKVSASLSMPTTDAQARPKRGSFGKPPSEPPPLPPQATPTAQQADTASKATRLVPRGLKNARPNEAPPTPPSQASVTPKTDQGLNTKANKTSEASADKDLDSAIDSLLAGLNDDDGGGSNEAANLSRKSATDGNPAVARDKDTASRQDELDALLNEMNSALSLDKALKDLENPVSSSGPKT